MAKLKAYDYRQRVFLPVSLEDQLMPGTLGFAIHTLVENRLDTSRFEERYRNDETGRTAYAPKILLKIILLGYARGLISGRGGKRRYLWVTIGAEITNLSKRMAAKIDTEAGRKIYPQRFAVAEPVFANIRTQKRLDRFTLRGKVKVNIQWLLYCMIHNIEKIKNYGFA
jgi:hypothetical protein